MGRRTQRAGEPNGPANRQKHPGLDRLAEGVAAVVVAYETRVDDVREVLRQGRHSARQTDRGTVNIGIIESHPTIMTRPAANRRAAPEVAQPATADPSSRPPELQACRPAHRPAHRPDRGADQWCPTEPKYDLPVAESPRGRIADWLGRVQNVATTMVPPSGLLTLPGADSQILANGRAVPTLRDELRRVPSFRNAASVVSCYLQIAVVIGVTVRLHNPLVWVPAFVLMGRAHAQLAALMHEAAHRLLFRNKAANDWVGRWLLGYPSFSDTDRYRRIHMAHHRDEFGPEEPDIPLYRGYPITAASLRRKLLRDATGQTGFKLLQAQFGALRRGTPPTRRAVRHIFMVQAVLAVAAGLAGYPLVYWLLWFVPYLTIWRVINRLRSIAEHGGMIQSKDRRETTHSVTQHWLARSILVPYWIGWHLAHHCDSGIPMRNLPRYHRALIASGYIPAHLEYRSYPALWRTLSSRPDGVTAENP
jgi:fatty acid desaturase